MLAIGILLFMCFHSLGTQLKQTFFTKPNFVVGNVYFSAGAEYTWFKLVKIDGDKLCFVVITQDENLVTTIHQDQTIWLTKDTASIVLNEPKVTS